ncbi:NupC/NupG family nucleoside CNT transporter [Salinifilum ghardaiensis]
MQVLWGIGGILVVLLLAVALSTNRRAIRPRTVLGALAIQIVFAVIVLRWDVGKQVLATVADGFRQVINSTREGIDFLLGPVMPEDPSETVVAFQVLPVIIFVASLSAILYHWNILQWVVRIIGGGLQKVLGTTRAESLNATANIFLGQTEAPLVIRPFLGRMTRSEFFAVMVGGLSTVAGTVMVGYALLGARLEHLIAASFMAAPAGLLMAKIIMPETEKPRSDRVLEKHGGNGSDGAESGSDGAGGNTSEGSESDGSEPDEESQGSPGTDRQPGEDTEAEQKPRNVIDAAAAGALDGLRLALNVGAMLFVFVSLVALMNLILGGIGGWFGAPDLTLEQILGYIFAPVMSAIGVPWDEAIAAGGFLGQKIVLNEFVAFADFGPQIDQFSEKSATIITFALTGFANVGSLGILLGGLGGLVPQRRSWIAQYGIRAILGGTLANLLSAAIAGILV